MRRILFITPKMYGGGAEKVTAILASAMARDCKVYLLNLRKESREDYYVSDRVNKLFLPDITSEGYRSDIEVKAEYIRELKKKLRIQCSISLLEEANFYNVRSKRDEKVIVSVRNSYKAKYGWPIREAKTAWKLTEYISLSNKIVAISQGVADEIDSMWPGHRKKIAVIYNLVDRTELKRLSEEPLSDEIVSFIRDSKVVTNFGRLVDQKGQLHLVRAFAKVCSKIPDAKLVIAGKGPIEETLTEEINRLSLSDRVMLAGRLEDPYPLLKASRVFVLSSLYEGLSNSLVEASALGVPMVSTDCLYGPREIIAGNSEYAREISGYSCEKYGILTQRLNGTDPQGEEGLRNALIYLLSNEDARAKYAAASKERGKDYDVETILSRWYSILPREMM